MGTETQGYDATKMQELLLLVAERSVRDPNFGKTKLNKILYYIDFEAYGRFGHPVTGAQYQRRPYGPVPREIMEARQELVLRGEARIETTNRFGYPQGRLIAERPANSSVFSAEELELIDDVIKGLWELSGAAASEKSHREPGWKIAEDGDTISYGTVFLDSRPLTDDDIRRGRELYRVYGSPRPTYEPDETITGYHHFTGSSGSSRTRSMYISST